MPRIVEIVIVSRASLTVLGSCSLIWPKTGRLLRIPAGIHPGDVGLQAYVDVSSIFVDSAALPVRTEIASKDLKVVKIEPPTVTVTAVEGSVGR